MLTPPRRIEPTTSRACISSSEQVQSAAGRSWELRGDLAALFYIGLGDVLSCHPTRIDPVGMSRRVFFFGEIFRCGIGDDRSPFGDFGTGCNQPCLQQTAHEFPCDWTGVFSAAASMLEDHGKCHAWLVCGNVTGEPGMVRLSSSHFSRSGFARDRYFRESHRFVTRPCRIFDNAR